MRAVSTGMCQKAARRGMDKRGHVHMTQVLGHLAHYRAGHQLPVCAAVPASPPVGDSRLCMA